MILLHAEAEEAGGGGIGLEISDDGGQLLFVVDGGDAGQRGLDGFGAELIGEIGVHAGGKEVAVFALQGRGGRVGGFFQIDVEQIAIALIELVEAAPLAAWSAGMGLFFRQLPQAYW